MELLKDCVRTLQRRNGAERQSSGTEREAETLRRERAPSRPTAAPTRFPSRARPRLRRRRIGGHRRAAAASRETIRYAISRAALLHADPAAAQHPSRAAAESGPSLARYACKIHIPRRRKTSRARVALLHP